MSYVSGAHRVVLLSAALLAACAGNGVGLVLDAAHSYALLVGVPSNEDPAGGSAAGCPLHGFF
jgi:hypothetical protein